MDLYEILVIYLSVGAPFGVLAVLRTRGRTRSLRALAAIQNVVLWPAAVVLQVSRARFSPSGVKFAADLSPDADRWAHAIADVLKAVRRTKNRRLEGLVSNYLHLRTEILGNRSSSPGGELLAIAGHPDPALGTACLARRRSRRLAEAGEVAATDLKRELDEMDPLDPSIDLVSRLIIDHTAELCDPVTLQFLSRLAEPQFAGSASPAFPVSLSSTAR